MSLPDSGPAIARFAIALQGHDNLATFSDQTLGVLIDVLDAHAGVIYLAEIEAEGEGLRCHARYAVGPDQAPDRIALGEGLIGQVARDGTGRSLADVAARHLAIYSGTLQADRGAVLIEPIPYEDQILGSVEIARLGAFSDDAADRLRQLLGLMGVAVVGIRAKQRTERLLRTAQDLTRRLESQQEELQTSNTRLAAQARLVGRQRDELERNNAMLERARTELEHRAEQLALSSRYKSQFLANMSHELRTPLNAVLILSNLLARNTDGHLDDKEVEFARTIHESGTDLLSLIDQILDLAKIESGTTELDLQTTHTADLMGRLMRTFAPTAEDRDLTFRLDIAEGTPPMLSTDIGRLKQILRNLLSNAIKFTEAGEVTLAVRPAAPEEIADQRLAPGAPVVAFEVRDTGIGIAQDKHRVIFQAFHQADGSITRRFGGTGLGLAISKEISAVLGGALTVDSRPDQGSTFTLYIPATHADQAGEPSEVSPADRIDENPGPAPDMEPGDQDDREQIAPGDRILLIIDDDPGFARTLMTVSRAHGFRCLLAGTASEGLELATAFRPDAITLDIGLPDQDGMEVLAELAAGSRTRAIPVHVLTGRASRDRALEAGARSASLKPVSSRQLTGMLDGIHAHIDAKMSRVLIVEDHAASRDAIAEMLSEVDLRADAVATASEAIRYLDEFDYDCLILDLVLPDMPGAEVIAAVRQRPALRRLPVIVYTGRALSEDESKALGNATASLIPKGLASAERLVTEVARHARRSSSRRSAAVPARQARLDGLRILVVDDDVRNVFAITALLEGAGAAVEFMEDGAAGVERILRGDPLDLVLMDIMMPGIDGYEATRQVRSDERFHTLPIIAVTARSMPLDRERCVAAGMNDHVAKPVDDAELLAAIQRWTRTEGR